MSDPAEMVRKHPHKERTKEYRKFCLETGRDFIK